jgi:osmotically-inducible protein OsmY
MDKLILTATGLLLMSALYDGRVEIAANRAEGGDESIERSVRRALEQDEVLGNADIEVQVVNGAVRLTGTVPSETGRVAALLVATSARGTRVLIDELRVTTPE